MSRPDSQSDNTDVRTGAGDLQSHMTDTYHLRWAMKALDNLAANCPRESTILFVSITFIKWVTVMLSRYIQDKSPQIFRPRVTPDPTMQSRLAEKLKEALEREHKHSASHLINTRITNTNLTSSPLDAGVVPSVSTN